MPMRQNVSSDLRHDLVLVAALMDMEDCAVPMSQSVSSDLRRDLPRRRGGVGGVSLAREAKGIEFFFFCSQNEMWDFPDLVDETSIELAGSEKRNKTLVVVVA